MEITIEMIKELREKNRLRHHGLPCRPNAPQMAIWTELSKNFVKKVSKKQKTSQP
jgi:hypothetical protein